MIYAAATCNAAWGAAVILWPGLLSRLVGLDVPNAIPLVQVVGMLGGRHARRPLG